MENREILERALGKRWYQLYMNPGAIALDRDRYKKKLLALPSGRRCLEKGTMITTSYGMIEIEKLKPGDEIIGYNSDGLPEKTTVLKTWSNGNQLVYPFTSSNKKYFAATENHEFLACNESYHDKKKVLLGNGYKKRPVKELTQRYRIKRQYLFDFINGGNKNVIGAYSLAALLGDGCCRDNKSTTGRQQENIYISSDNHIVPEAICDELNFKYFSAPKNNNYTWKLHYGLGVLDVVPFYKEWCTGRYAHEKIVDWDEINTWDKDSCMNFIAGLIDTDGSIYYKNSLKKEIVISVDMMSKSVVECFRNIIFKYFQERLTLHEENREKYKGRIMYSVKTSSNECAIRILSVLEKYLKKKKGFDVGSLNIRNILPDRIGFKKGKSYLAETFDITVDNKTNLYFLHEGGLITRNSGKTERFKRHIISLGLKRWLDSEFPHMEQNYFLAAPTYGQAKKIFWKHQKQFLYNIPRQIKDISESDLRICLHHPNNEERIVAWWVFGMDKPERMEGIDWDGGGCDEFGNTKADTYGEHIQPALATPGRDTFFWPFGVPEGRNHYYELAMYILNHMEDDNDFGYYIWPSSEVLDASVISRAKDILDPKSFAQEYEASWETKSGLVYYAWAAQHSPKGNIDNDIKYDKSLPIYIGMDFNVDPMTAILCHHVMNDDSKLETWVFDSFFERNSNTRTLTEKILNKYSDAPSYVLTPCQSGLARQTSQEIGKTDLKIIEDIFRQRECILRLAKRSKNPTISDRVNVVNSRLYHKMIRINCNEKGNKELVKDFEALSYKPGTSDIDDTNKMRMHISSALGYSEEYHFDIKSLVHSDKEERGFIP